MLAVMSIPRATEQVEQSAIHVQGLEKSFKQLKVLRGVDIEVQRGSILALLGSNGAGKTTLVKILCTLLKADAGTAAVNGFDVATQAADVRESTRSSPGGRTSSWSPGCGTSRTRVSSRTTCCDASR